MMMGDVKHLFMFLSAIWMSSLDKGLFRSFAHLLIVWSVVLLLSYKSTLYILGMNPLCGIVVCKYFSHSIGWLFIFLIVSFDTKVFIILMKTIYLFFLLLLVLWCPASKKSLLNSKSWRFNSYKLQCLPLGLWSIWSWVLDMMWGMGPHFFTYG